MGEPRKSLGGEQSSRSQRWLGRVEQPETISLACTKLLPRCHRPTRRSTIHTISLACTKLLPRCRRPARRSTSHIHAARLRCLSQREAGGFPGLHAYTACARTHAPHKMSPAPLPAPRHTCMTIGPATRIPCFICIMHSVSLLPHTGVHRTGGCRT